MLNTAVVWWEELLSFKLTQERQELKGGEGEGYLEWWGATKGFKAVITIKFAFLKPFQQQSRMTEGGPGSRESEDYLMVQASDDDKILTLEGNSEDGEFMTGNKWGSSNPQSPNAWTSVQNVQGFSTEETVDMRMTDRKGPHDPQPWSGTETRTQEEPVGEVKCSVLDRLAARMLSLERVRSQKTMRVKCTKWKRDSCRQYCIWSLNRLLHKWFQKTTKDRVLEKSTLLAAHQRSN